MTSKGTLSSNLPSYRPSFKKKGKAWDGEAHQGNLWIWMGAFKRWKKRCFSCAQPGLLTYNSPPKRGRKVTGGSINLHKAIITMSPDDPRYFRIQTPTGSAFHLRTVDAEDRELCVASIKVQTHILILRILLQTINFQFLA